MMKPNDPNISASMLSALQNANSILLCTHISPDGDAIGATLAMGHALRAMGKRTLLACADPVPARLRLLPGADADIQIIDPNCEWVYDGRKSFSKTKSSLGVYQDMKLKGKVVTTLVRGEVVYDGEKIVAEEGHGSLVTRRK